MKKLLLTLTAMSICTAALAASSAPTVTMDPKADVVLIRLALTGDEVKAIDKINADADGKKADLKGAKLTELREQVKKDIRAALTADQQTKFDAGLKIVADYDAAVKAAKTEMAAAVKADATKKADAKKTCDDKIAAAAADRDKALDDKVGKVPAK